MKCRLKKYTHFEGDMACIFQAVSYNRFHSDFDWSQARDADTRYLMVVKSLIAWGH